MRLRTRMVAVAVVTSLFALHAKAQADDTPFYPQTAGAPLGAPPFQGGHGHVHATGDGSSGLHALHEASVPLGPNGPMMGPPGAGYPGPGMPPGGVLPAGAQMPPGTLPWPQISPYEHSFERTRTKDGLWYRDVFNETNRTYHARVGATLLQVRKPNRFRVNVGSQQVLEGSADDLNAPQFSTIDTSAFNDNPTFPLNGSLTTTFNADVVGQTRDVLGKTAGGRVIFGYTEPWGTGFEANAWFTPENQATYSRGVGNDLNPDPTEPRVTHSLALEDPDLSVEFVPFDQKFAIHFTSVYAGAGVNWFTNDMWPRKEVRFRVTPGFRYLYIYESFGFHGIDSGAAVGFNPDGTPDGTFTPIVNPFESVIDSSTESNLLGPEIGIDYGIGGDTLQLNGRSKIGVLVNLTEYKLSGRGVGNPFNDPSYNQRLTFAESERHTHVSPMFEQELALDMNIIGIIPVLKHQSWLEKARIHVGYSVVLLWEVARPQYNIQYNNQPRVPVLVPNLASQRTQWYTHGWDFALLWEW